MGMLFCESACVLGSQICHNVLLLRSAAGKWCLCWFQKTCINYRSSFLNSRSSLSDNDEDVLTFDRFSFKILFVMMLIDNCIVTSNLSLSIEKNYCGIKTTATKKLLVLKKHIFCAFFFLNPDAFITGLLCCYFLFTVIVLQYGTLLLE